MLSSVVFGVALRLLVINISHWFLFLRVTQKKYSLLKIMDICQFQIAFLMFNFTISKLPSMFNSYLTHTSSIHHYSTRSSISGFAMPSVRTKIRQRSIKYKGPFVWNKLSTEIKNLPSVSTFKTKLKQYTLDSY